MYIKTLSTICAVVMLSGCGGGSSSISSVSEITEDSNLSDTNLSSDTNESLKVSYIEDMKANILNPDRGFYDASYALEENTSYNMFEDLRDEGYTLAYASINLQDYNDTATLPDDILDNISKNLSDANSSGVKLVFRIKYRSSVDSNDTSKDIITQHLAQLKPILQTYSDTISVVQAGVIGAWGEWHSFTGDYADSNSSYLDNRRDILTSWVDILPDKYIQIRTPMHKEQLLGAGGEYGDESTEGEITPDIAYSDDIRAKVGYHNDCVLANKTDMGTYPSDDIEFWKDYVKNDTLYAPIGGETCGIGDDEDANLSDCSNALKEFETMHYSFLNDNYHPDVLDKWKDQGCYDTIKYNLGYRLVANSLELNSDDSGVDISLSITNKGYASAYNSYPVKFILKNINHTYIYNKDEDTRKWYPQKTQVLTQYISYSDIDHEQKYCLYLQIGEGNTSVRFSNQDMWDDELKANKLLCDF